MSAQHTAADRFRRPLTTKALGGLMLIMIRTLFKFMPSQYVDDFVGRGRTLFRNLTYFRECEDDGRGDVYEGRHIDRPGAGVTITHAGGTPAGDFAYVNSVNTEGIYVFCVATRLDPALYGVFDAEACVEICSPRQFFRDCRAAARHLWSLEHGHVEYYSERERARGNIKDPGRLPFFKPRHFQNQSEYRFILASPEGLALTQRIVVGNALRETEQPRGEQARSLVLQLRGKRASRNYMRVHYGPRRCDRPPNSTLQLPGAPLARAGHDLGRGAPAAERPR